MLNRNERKHMKNLIMVFPKTDGTIVIAEKLHESTMNFENIEAASEYLTILMKGESNEWQTKSM